MAAFFINKKLFVMYRIILLLTFLSILTVGCLDTDFEDPNSVFLLTSSFGEEDFELERGDDEIQIVSVRYVIDNIQLVEVNENEEFASDPRYVSLATQGVGGPTQLGAGEIFGGSYTGVSYNLALAPDNGTVNDDLLIERDDQGNVIARNSAVIVVLYNSELYTITTNDTPELLYSFDRNINMPEKLGSLEVNLAAEWQEWFLNEERDEILKPNNSQDREKIIENFKRFFTAQTITTGEM